MLTRVSRLSTFFKNFSLSLFGLWVLGACTNPNVSTPPADTFKPRNEWYIQLHWDNACEQAYQNTNVTDETGIEVYTLAHDDALVRVLCAVGSYQPSFLLYRLKNQHATLLKLETYTANDSEDLQRSTQSELWGEIFVNPLSGKMNLLTAARQTKDCGTWAEYRITAETLQLQSLYSKIPCVAEISDPVSPEASAPPEDWKHIDTQ